MKPTWVRICVTLLVVTVSILSILTVKKAVFSPLLYCLYTVIYNLVLYKGLQQNKNYFIKYLSVLLWLGLWLKIPVDILIGSGGEAVGRFSSSREEWDNLLTVGIWAGLAVLIAIQILTKLSLSTLEIPNQNTKEKNLIPKLYSKYRKLNYFLLVSLIILGSYFNYQFGLHIVGVIPNIIGGFIFSKLFVWMIMHGFVIVATTFLFWDVLLGKRIVAGTVVIVVEGFFTCTFKLSRTIFFHYLPQMYTTYVNRKRIVQLKVQSVLFLLVMTVLLTGLSGYLVTKFRNSKYITTANNQEALLGTNSALTGHNVYWETLSKLLIYRWVGLEGVKSVVSYKDKSWQKFSAVLIEVSEPDKTSLYDREIARSIYNNNSHTQFATLPGVVAFLYISGEVWFVFIGVLLLTFLFYFLEIASYYLTKNSFLASYYGLNLALTLTQLGYQTTKWILYFVMFNLSFGFICLVQYYAERKNE